MNMMIEPLGWESRALWRAGMARRRGKKEHAPGGGATNARSYSRTPCERTTAPKRGRSTNTNESDSSRVRPTWVARVEDLAGGRRFRGKANERGCGVRWGTLDS